MSANLPSAWKAQQEANREKRLRQLYPSEQLLQWKLAQIAGLIRLDPHCEPTVQDLAKPPGALVPPPNAKELLQELMREVRR